MRPHPEIMPWFFGVWIALAIVGMWAVYLDDNIARKKRFIPVFIVGTGVLFLLFMLVITGDLNLMTFAAPVVALITFLNLRQFRVCSACGKTIHSGMWFAKARYCPKCGTQLE